MDKISIIIPAYNAEKYITKTITSAKDQTWKDTEIIIVNDGSTDETLEKASSFEGVHVINKSNGRTASALNVGITLATGSWIHWLSADDILYKDALETMMNDIVQHTQEQQRNTIFYSNYDVIDESDNILYPFVEPNRNVWTYKQRQNELFENFFGNGSSTMIHKNVFDVVGMYDESLPYFEDYEFWLRCMFLHNIDMCLVPQSTLQYRRHEGQISKNVDLTWNDTIRKRVNEKLTKTTNRKKITPVNILHCIPSPRNNIPEVQKYQTRMPFDRFIPFYIKESKAYQHCREFFLQHPEYTHLAIGTDDIVVRPEDILHLAKILENNDYGILSGVMNVIENDNSLLNICMNFVSPVWAKRHYNWIAKKDLAQYTQENEIIPVAFSGFPLMIIRRDIIEKIPFYSDSEWNDVIPEDGGSLDVQFCYNAIKQGYEIHADTRVVLKHLRSSGKSQVGEKSPFCLFWKSNGNMEYYEV